ncbi:CDP-diacylglycerol--serine O-phosphatidyltransferase [Algoriphagus sp.]|uniref:CDP-diacylglycerol--serine O-phosphatidyltransferase n=1 Tax=Algoriphagus sp. TaxID=1872435 RepID=UPI0025E01459|nr:CDP-diacylglycerol--serine O-phosphatidyltransferase [Algoriphagus sp.]
MKIKSHIPNSITLLNLLSGIIGIIWVLDGNIISGAWFILISAFLDFVDGFAARILKVQGELGKQLDSLADLVSFGVLPGIILFAMAKTNSQIEWLPYCTLILPLFSALRLAKFNLDTRQTDRFIGVPTPAAALFVSTIPHFAIQWPKIGTVITSPFFVVAIALSLSILLISEIPLIALKFKSFAFSKNIFRYVLIVVSLLLFVWLGLAGIPLIIISYLGLSVTENAMRSE